MKIVFEKAPLIAAVTPAMNATSNKNTLTAIDGLLFDAKDGVCVITAYDNEKGIRTSVEAEVKEEGSYIINAQKFYSIIKTMPNDEITVTVNDRMNVKIESGKSTFELHALPGSDFPSLPTLSGERSFELPQHLMKKFINQTSFAIAQKDQRAIFTGAHFRVSGDGLTVVSCDSNRLSKCTAACAVTNVKGDDAEMKFNVPGKTLAELGKLISDSEDTVSVALTRKHVIFTISNDEEDARTGDIVFFSRLIDGEYIDYDRIIPSTQKISVSLDRSFFADSLERASLMIEEKSGSGRGYVTCDFSGDRLAITSGSISGSHYDEIPIEKTGEDIKIGFNCRFLLDAVRAADSDRINIALSTPLMGVAITDAGERADDEGDYLFFVMPVRMKD